MSRKTCEIERAGLRGEEKMLAELTPMVTAAIAALCAKERERAAGRIDRATLDAARNEVVRALADVAARFAAGERPHQGAPCSRAPSASRAEARWTATYKDRLTSPRG